MYSKWDGFEEKKLWEKPKAAFQIDRLGFERWVQYPLFFKYKYIDSLVTFFAVSIFQRFGLGFANAKLYYTLYSTSDTTSMCVVWSWFISNFDLEKEKSYFDFVRRYRVRRNRCIRTPFTHTMYIVHCTCLWVMDKRLTQPNVIDYNMANFKWKIQCEKKKFSMSVRRVGNATFKFMYYEFRTNQF